MIVCSVCPTPWTIACQAPLSRKFSQQGYWSGLPIPSPDLALTKDWEPMSPALQMNFFLPLVPPGKPNPRLR